VEISDEEVTTAKIQPSVLAAVMLYLTEPAKAAKK